MGSEYISDPDFDGDTSAVREHYRRVERVFATLGMVDETYPTLGFAGNAGWYDHHPVTKVAPREEGWDARSRALTLTRDWEIILEDTGGEGKARTIYNITSWKEPDSVFERRLHRFEPGEEESKWQGGIDPLPDYRDLRGFGFWVDLDLADELKPKRGGLDAGTVETVEAAQRALIEEVAALYGDSEDAIYGLDSGGGSYVYGPPEATLPIADYFADDDEARQWVFDELRTRLTDWATGDSQFEGMWPRVRERVDGAGEVLDPDFMQNKNRQSKAPLAIHQDHDIVVTPLRARDPETGEVTGAVDYSPTLVSDVDDDLIDQTEQWAHGLTTPTHTEATESLITTLWPEYADDGTGWRAILDAWVEDQRQKEEASAVETPDTPTDVDLADLEITTCIDDVYADIAQLDIEAVAEKTLVHKWTDRASGLTDRSGDGKRAFVPTWGPNANSGNANYVDREQGIWVDTGQGDHGTAVEMALIAEEGWPRGKIANGEDWARGVDYLREMGFEIQVHIPDATESEDGEMPYWAVRRAAVALGVVDEDEFVEREHDDGGTYQGFPDAETYNATLEKLADRGVEHGREQIGSRSSTSGTDDQSSASPSDMQDDGQQVETDTSWIEESGEDHQHGAARGQTGPQSNGSEPTERGESSATGDETTATVTQTENDSRGSHAKRAETGESEGQQAQPRVGNGTGDAHQQQAAGTHDDDHRRDNGGSPPQENRRSDPSVIGQGNAPSEDSRNDSSSGQGKSHTSSPAETARNDESGNGLDDEEVLDIALNAQNEDIFGPLWHGNWRRKYDTREAAEAALATKLAFYTGKDREQMDRLFRQSALYREKWNEMNSQGGRTYGEYLISQAIERVDDIYEPQIDEQRWGHEDPDTEEFDHPQEQGQATAHDGGQSRTSQPQTNGGATGDRNTGHDQHQTSAGQSRGRDSQHPDSRNASGVEDESPANTHHSSEASSASGSDQERLHPNQGEWGEPEIIKEDDPQETTGETGESQPANGSTPQQNNSPPTSEDGQTNGHKHPEKPVSINQPQTTRGQTETPAWYDQVIDFEGRMPPWVEQLEQRIEELEGEVDRNEQLIQHWKQRAQVAEQEVAELRTEVEILKDLLRREADVDESEIPVGPEDETEDDDEDGSGLFGLFG